MLHGSNGTTSQWRGQPLCMITGALPVRSQRRPDSFFCSSPGSDWVPSDLGSQSIRRRSLGSARQPPWLDAAVGRSPITQAWSNTVACVDDAALDPRMRAQQGCFLVGGLIKRYAGKNLTINGVVQPVQHWPDITTLRVCLPARCKEEDFGSLAGRWVDNSGSCGLEVRVAGATGRSKCLYRPHVSGL